MGIISEFVREQKRYTKNDLKHIFKFSTEDVDSFIRRLKAFGVLKAVKNISEQRELSDLLDDDIEVSDVDSESEDYLYVFTYVGVIAVGSRIIKCYPKYLLTEANLLEEMKDVLKVIGRYGSKEQIINLYNGDAENSSFNILAVILFLLNDYHNDGIYKNYENIREVNGEGEILWDLTVNENFSLVSNNKPYYLELYTGKTVDDELDFFKRLHECILSQCSKQLETSDLLDLFDMVPINLSEELLDDLGDIDYILYRLESEISIQFNTRKQVLLKTIYSYISHNRTLEDSYGISMYGTNNFNLIWEDICSDVFSNKLQTPLGQIKFPVPLRDSYQSTDKLIDIIEKPKWFGVKINGMPFEITTNETLKPDIVGIYQQNNIYHFVILDAKYYNIQLEEAKPLHGQPGVGDISKQYLYQLAYKKFLIEHEITEVRNCFLLPISTNIIVEKGIVKMDILSSLGLSDIQIRQLPAKTMYNYYLDRRTLDLSVLNL